MILNYPLSNRFGNNFSLGGGLDFITEQKNLIFGLKGNNLFGNTVKEDVLASLRDRDGFILGSIGAGQATYAEVFLRERGLYAGGHFGKLIGLSKKINLVLLRISFSIFVGSVMSTNETSIPNLVNI